MEVVTAILLAKGIATLLLILLTYVSREAMVIVIVAGAAVAMAPQAIALAIAKSTAAASGQWAIFSHWLTSGAAWSAVKAGWGTITSTVTGWMWWQAPPPLVV